MKIDSHQHFWSYEASAYPWMTEELKALRRDFLPGDLALEMDRIGIDGSIAVQARQNLTESRWLLELAQENPRILGVVGWVDLQSEDLRVQLEEFDENPKWKGVRHVVQDEVDERFLLRDSVLRGIQTLKDYGLVYDILIYSRQLPSALEMVGKFPEQVFVLDHLAKPVIRSGELNPWKDSIREMARHPGVSCKVSGMVTEAKWQGWRDEDFRPYLDTVFEAFGEDRVLFGSDWPVCTLAGSYSEVAGIMDRYLEGCSELVKEKFWGSNSRRIYRIES